MAALTPSAAPANTCPRCAADFDTADFRGVCDDCGYVPGQGAD